MGTRSVDPPARGVLAATLASATVIAHLVAAKAARDALFLAGFEVALLPRMMMLGAVVSLATALVSSRVMERLPPVKLLLGALATSALLYAVEFALIDAHPRSIALLLYVHVSALGATLVAALWSLVNERFDPHQAKQEIARVALGGSLGGVLGGIAGWLVGGARGVPFMLVMLGVLNLVTIGIVLEVARTGASARARPPAGRVSALEALKSSPYLSTLAALVALSSLSSALLDYVLSARAVETDTDPARLAAFFALFHAAVGLIAMLVQLTLTRISLERLGLSGTVALVPGAVLSMGMVALFFPQVWSAIVLRGSEALVQASLSRSAYELLYTPLPREQKRPAKILIDVGVDRLGTVAGAALTTLLVSVLAVRGVRFIVALAMCVSLGALYCAVRLNRGYIDALAGRLRRGTFRLDPRHVLDATTRRTLAESSALDREELLGAIQRRTSRPPPAYERAPANRDAHETEDTVLVGPGGAGFEVAPGYVGLQLGSATPFGTNEAAGDDDALLHSIADLRSGDIERIRSALASPLVPALAVHVVPLLGSDEVARDALQALRGVVEQATGTLADSLLDPGSSVVVRRRIPRVLERCPTTRAIQALVDGLFDPEHDVRSQCALALLRAVELDPRATLPREQILDAIQDELAREQPLLLSGQAADALDDGAGFSETELRTRVERGIEQVMTLLAVTLEPEPVRLAYHALFGDDPAIRGTALEYLDNVVPERIRPGVLALFEGTLEGMPGRPRRDRATLEKELARARAALIPSSAGTPRRGAAR
jgi:ATP:ADP antiporter, AAA family